MKTSANNLSYISDKVKNIPRKLKREFYKLPLLQTIQEQAYQTALDTYARFLPELDDQGLSIVKTLREEGSCMIPLEDLVLPSTEEMMRTAFSLANNLKNPLSNAHSSNGCEVGSSQEDLGEFPEILFWALEPKLLDIIENYIGLPILYQFFAMRRSIIDGQHSGVRRWHIDFEDRRTIKIIIYLNDVVAGGGPYEYISRSLTSKAVKKLNYDLGYVSDEKMATAVSKSDWTTCLAKKGTVIISDTASVFHRAQPPFLNERFSITFCYTSANPQVVWKSREISSEHWEMIDSTINQRQKNCLDQKRLTKFCKC